MVGLKEETTGVIHTTEAAGSLGYKHTIDFTDQAKGSDIWLFSQTTELNKHFEDLVVLLSPAGNTKAWYTLDTRNYKLNIFTSEPSLVSYRLTAPRFDSESWANERDDESIGYDIAEVDWTENLNGTVIGAVEAISETFEAVTANVVEATDIVADSITLQGSSLKAYITGVVEEILADRTVTEEIISPVAQIDTLTVGSQQTTGSHPSLSVVGNASISGELIATEVTTTDLTTDTLTASSINSPAIDSIRTKLEELTADYTNYTATASASPTTYWDEELIATLREQVSATDSAHIAVDTLDAKFGFFENYLAVMGKTITTDLDVTNNLSTNSIASLDDTLSIQPSGQGAINFLAGLVTMDDSGLVTINGDLNINGTLTADKAQFDTLVLGDKTATPSSQFANLLELRGVKGKLVASIDNTGRAEFNEVATQGLTIASDASASAEIASSSATIKSNATAGKATLPAGLTEMTIETPHVEDDALVYVTPVGDPNNQVLYVKSKLASSWFKVAINTDLPHDLEFNWWIIKLE